MKRLLPLLSIAVLGSFNLVEAQTTCQNISVSLDGSGAYIIQDKFPTPGTSNPTQAGVFTGNSVWQEFQGAFDAILHSVEVNFTADHTPATTFTLNVYENSGTGGTLLATEVYTSATTFTTGANQLELSSRIDITGGNQYTFELVDDNGDPFQLEKDGTGSYADGVSSITGEDLVFSILHLEPSVLDNGSTAASGIFSFEASPSILTCSEIGVNTVTLTVTENNGGTSTCTADVTVADNENPTFVCQNITVFIPNSGTAVITTADVDGGTNDNCSIATISASQTSFNCSDIGANTVTLSGADPTGNTGSCTATVTVADTTRPAAVCQNHTLVLNGSGNATLTIPNVDGGSSDNCGITSSTLSQTSFNCANIGANTVTLTLQDAEGNTNFCTATVTVEDNQAPVITCPPSDIVCADGASGVVYTYPTVVGSDNCTFNVDQTDASGLTSGSVFPVGTTTQEYTITETETGVTASCSFTVTVTAKPVADFSFTPACEGEAVFFTDLSTIDASSSLSNWSWDMGDGSGTITLVDPIFSYADTGSYDVELIVESAEGCADTSTQTIAVTPVPTAGFTVTNNCEGLATVFTNTSAIDAGTMTYEWNFGDSNTSTDENPSHVYSSAGTYTVTLIATSNNGCVDEFVASVEVFDSPTALFTASTECFGTATEFTNLSSGDAPLTYSWDFGDSNTSSDQNPTNLYATAGTYTVSLTTTSTNGCENTSTVMVPVNELPIVDFSFTDVCEGSTANFVNLSSPGNANWDLGDGTSSTLSSVNHVYSAFGSYEVILSVTDANLCANADTQTIEIFDLPDFALTPSDVLCFGEATGGITTTPLGTPTFPWMVSLNGGTPQNNGSFQNLAAGTYEVTVMDDNSCEFTVLTDVEQPTDTLGINLNSVIDVACNGETSGEINLAATGGTAPYSYSINGGTVQSTGMFSGLPAGTHDVQILDFNFCVFDTTITLTEPDTLVLALDNSSDLLCNGDNSGELLVDGIGGVGPYEYNIDGGAYGMSNSFSGLSAATYTVGVLDANGCEDTLHVTLTEPGILMISLLNSEDADCFGQASGLIEVAASSGTPGYQYSINGVTTQGSGLFEGVAAGTYTLTAVDANGCIDQLTETIEEPAELTIETNSTPVSCFGESTGEIEIISSGGTPGYAYSVDAGGTFSQNGGAFSNLPSGEYIAVVADTNGCTASEGVILSQPAAAFDLTADVSDALCLDSASGSALLSGIGGTPTYTYSSDGTSYTAANEFGGFTAGTYTLYGLDLNGCADSVEFIVGEPLSSVSINDILTNNPACPNEASGTALVQVSGGTPGYTFSSNAGVSFQSSQILEGLNGGNHIVVVQDANGCVDTDTITLESPALLDLVLDTVIGVSCAGDLTGSLEVLALGGTPSYNYSIEGGNVQSNGVFNNLTNNTYEITVMDVNGCMYSEFFVVSAETLQPIADFSWIASGQAILFTNESQYATSYSWNFGDDSTSTEESPVHFYQFDGNYSVTLTASNECGSDEVTITASTIGTGIEQAEENLFKLYPNPTAGDLNLELIGSIDGNLIAEIVSVDGQLIKSVNISNTSIGNVIQINTSELSQGVYALRLTSETNYSVLKFDIIK